LLGELSWTDSIGFCRCQCRYSVYTNDRWQVDDEQSGCSQLHDEQCIVSCINDEEGEISAWISISHALFIRQSIRVWRVRSDIKLSDTSTVDFVLYKDTCSSPYHYLCLKDRGSYTPIDSLATTCGCWGTRRRALDVTTLFRKICYCQLTFLTKPQLISSAAHWSTVNVLRGGDIPASIRRFSMNR
jgi:hypothetical protein